MNLAFLAILQILVAGVARADYPERAVRLIVPFPPGGPTDVLARLLAQHMGDSWRSSIVIENRAGANSAVGAQQVARAPPDGYTLLLALDTTLILNEMTMKGLAYKADDFAPISLASMNTSILVTRADGPATVAELIDKGRSQPGTLNYGAGIITTRLAGFLFNKLAGIDAVFVQYGGSSDVMRGLLDGSIHYAVDGVAPYVSLIKDGKLRALAKLNNRHLEALPDLKPLHEVAELSTLGEISTWVGFVAPAGTPKPIIETIHKAVAQATEDRGVASRLRPFGIVPVSSTPAEFDAFIKSERARWLPIVQSSGLTAK
jgi:tripartite-type tricarboxylate transporter receptor subunit TctC